MTNVDLDTSAASSRSAAKSASSGGNTSFEHSFIKPRKPLRAPATTKRTYKKKAVPRGPAKDSPSSSSSEDGAAVDDLPHQNDDLPHQNERKSKSFYPGARTTTAIQRQRPFSRSLIEGLVRDKHQRLKIVWNARLHSETPWDGVR